MKKKNAKLNIYICSSVCKLYVVQTVAVLRCSNVKHLPHDEDAVWLCNWRPFFVLCIQASAPKVVVFGIVFYYTKQ